MKWNSEVAAAKQKEEEEEETGQRVGGGDAEEGCRVSSANCIQCGLCKRIDTRTHIRPRSAPNHRCVAREHTHTHRELYIIKTFF